MKQIKLLAGAAALMLLAACSNEGNEPSNGNQNYNYSGTEGYLNVGITLPTEAGSRSGDSGPGSDSQNDQFKDGLESEYKVHNATLVVFKGQANGTEESATIIGAYDLSFSMNKQPVNGQITSQGEAVLKIATGDTSIGENTYALVILNNNGTFKLVGNDLIIGDKPMMGLTLKELTQATVDAQYDLSKFYSTTGGILMTNAVLTDQPGSTGTGHNTRILADVTSSIYSTEAEAKTNATEILVERAVAKVTVTDASTSTADPLTINGTTFNYKIGEWELLNTNTKSYLVRNWGQTGDGFSVGNAWYALTSAFLTENKISAYRFSGNSVVQVTSEQQTAGFTPVKKTWYRTYWGLDPNYTGAAADLNREGDLIMPYKAGDTNNTNKGVPAYCLENTFGVADMMVKNTTAAVVTAKVYPGENAENVADYYTVNDVRSVLYNRDQIENYVKERYNAKYDLKERWKAVCPEDLKGVEGTVTANVTLEDKTSGITVASNQQVKTIELVFTYEETQADETKVTKTSTVEDKALLTDFNKTLEINKYAEGKNYYTILVKHFGDDLTPWDQTKDTAIKGGKVIDNAYPNRSQANYLGRYGVLRNNWYDIEVSGISGLGYASDPSAFIKDDGTPDDMLESYLAFRINVMSWAVRKQIEVLK